MGIVLDITNQRFGNLVAVKKVSSRNGKTYWLCQCDCGNTKEIQTGHLTNGSIFSCGCIKKKIIKICPICGTKFQIEQFGDLSRKYCFNCSPRNRAGDYTPLLHAMKRQIIKEKGGKCQKCGYDKCEDALCFHHRDPNMKDFNLSMKSGSCNWEKYKEEAEKCDLLCANCHIEEHQRLRNEIKILSS